MDIYQRANNQVRIVKGKSLIGCGFICGPRHVLTCTHVADDAVVGATSVSAGSKIRGFLPNVSDEAFQLKVRHFYRDEGKAPNAGKAAFQDICLLELEDGHSFPAGYTVAAFYLSAIYNGMEFLGSGIQKAADTGYSLHGWVREKNGHWFEIESTDKEGAVEPGCSGGPLYYKEDGIIGMIPARQLEKRGFIIPSSLICDFLREAGPEVTATTTGSAIPRTSLGNHLHLLDRQGQYEDFTAAYSQRRKAAFTCTIAGTIVDEPSLLLERLKTHAFGLPVEMIRLRPLPDGFDMSDVNDTVQKQKSSLALSLGCKTAQPADIARALKKQKRVVIASTLCAPAGDREPYVQFGAAWLAFIKQIHDSGLKYPLIHFFIFDLTERMAGQDTSDEARQTPKDRYVAILNRLEPAVSSDSHLVRTELLGHVTQDDIKAWVEQLAKDRKLGSIDPSAVIRSARGRFAAKTQIRLQEIVSWADAYDQGKA